MKAYLITFSSCLWEGGNTNKSETLMGRSYSTHLLLMTPKGRTGNTLGYKMVDLRFDDDI